MNPFCKLNYMYRTLQNSHLLVLRQIWNDKYHFTFYNRFQVSQLITNVSWCLTNAYLTKISFIQKMTCKFISDSFGVSIFYPFRHFILIFPKHRCNSSISCHRGDIMRTWLISIYQIICFFACLIEQFFSYLPHNMFINPAGLIGNRVVY